LQYFFVGGIDLARMISTNKCAKVLGTTFGLIFISFAGVASAQVYGNYGGYGNYYGAFQQVYSYPQQYFYQYPIQYQYTYQYPQPYSGPNINVTSPRNGAYFESGRKDVSINWTVRDEPARSKVQLELYSASGNRIGIIAEVSPSEKNYNWGIPERVENCTRQYQYRLCGVYLEGYYYIRAMLTTENGYPVTSSQSGVFIIHQVSSGNVRDFSARPTSGYEPLRVTFRIVSEGGNYVLNFGDGDTEEVRIPAIYCFAAPCNSQPVYVPHTYRSVGTFFATLKNSSNDIVGRESIWVR
jgi:PKD repeat protein